MPDGDCRLTPDREPPVPSITEAQQIEIQLQLWMSTPIDPWLQLQPDYFCFAVEGSNWRWDSDPGTFCIRHARMMTWRS